MNLKNLKLGTRIEVDWADTTTHDSGWFAVDDYDFEMMAKATKMQTIGYFVKVDRGLLHLSMIKRQINDKFSFMSAIPVGCIKSVRRVK